MSKRELRVGERVRLKGYSYGGKDVDGKKGVVQEDAAKNGDRCVLLDNSGEVCVKPSQVVRLKPRKRREFWIVVNKQEVLGLRTTRPTDGPDYYSSKEIIHVREVPKKGGAS